MRHLDLSHSRPRPGGGERTARLTRHLEARLLDFDPGGPEVLETDQRAGFVAVRFPGHTLSEVLEALAARGVLAEEESGRAVFHLSPDLPFEGLDYLWGCLFEILF